jgi:hypothetical protein
MQPVDKSTEEFEQLALFEKRIGDNERPLTIDEIKAELRLCFEILSMKSARNEDGEVVEEHALLAVSLKVNAKIVDRLGTSHFSAKVVQITMIQITVTQLEKINALDVVKRVVSSEICGLLRREGSTINTTLS